MEVEVFQENKQGLFRSRLGIRKLSVLPYSTYWSKKISKPSSFTAQEMEVT